MRKENMFLGIPDYRAVNGQSPTKATADGNGLVFVAAPTDLADLPHSQPPPPVPRPTVAAAAVPAPRLVHCKTCGAEMPAAKFLDPSSHDNEGPFKCRTMLALKAGHATQSDASTQMIDGPWKPRTPKQRRSR